jgi:NAD(P)-dependent dehydrogenase (short-subunit alcohol dehydrogenase family)
MPPKKIPPQHQDTQPGIEKNMTPRPKAVDNTYKGSNKLQEKVAIITGGDSGIGRAVAILFAREGANIVVSYLNEHDDAKETKRLVEKEGRKCLLIASDVSEELMCVNIIEQTLRMFGKLDILVNNAAVQFPQNSILSITEKQLTTTFRTNIFSYFFMVKSALPHLKEGSVIINTTSVTAYRGSEQLLDYSATKGAIVAFTRSLSLSLIKQGIRVNGVAPGPVWTPLIPSTFDKKKVSEFGQQVPMQRPGQPEEIAPSYVFLASDDSSFFSGQILHPNGGEVINT